MTKRQTYIIGGAAGLALVILVALIAYYRVKFKHTEEVLATEQASRVKFQDESKRLERELNQSQEEVAAKIIKIEILEETIGEIQQQAVNISKAKAKIEAEKRKLEEERRKREAEYQDLVGSLEQEIKNREIQITELQGMLTVNLMDKILFDSGRSVIKPAGKRVLDKIARTFLNRYPEREIRVEGHTDNMPFRGSALNNWDLSTERAISAVRYLQEHANVAPSRLAAVGYAYHRPIDTSETREGRARNRRIEIVVMPPKKAIAE